MAPRREIRQRSLSMPRVISAIATAPVSLHWDIKEDSLLREAVARFGPKRWRDIAAMMAARRKNRSAAVCRDRWQVLTNHGEPPEKRKWSVREDTTLVALVERHAFKNWALIASELPGRSAKQCRERWQNQVRPDLNHGPWTPDEDAAIVACQRMIGNKWATIAERLPGRTDNMVKNRWYSTLARGTLPDSSAQVGESVWQPVMTAAPQTKIKVRGKAKKRRRTSTSAAKKKKRSVPRPTIANIAVPAPTPPMTLPNDAIESPDAVDGPIEAIRKFPSLEVIGDDDCEDCDAPGVQLEDMGSLPDDWYESLPAQDDRYDEWVPDGMLSQDSDPGLVDLVSWRFADRGGLQNDDQKRGDDEVDVVGDALESPLHQTAADAFQCEV